MKYNIFRNGGYNKCEFKPCLSVKNTYIQKPLKLKKLTAFPSHVPLKGYLIYTLSHTCGKKTHNHGFVCSMSRVEH